LSLFSCSCLLLFFFFFKTMRPFPSFTPGLPPYSRSISLSVELLFPFPLFLSRFWFEAAFLFAKDRLPPRPSFCNGPALLSRKRISLMLHSESLFLHPPCLLFFFFFSHCQHESSLFPFIPPSLSVMAISFLFLTFATRPSAHTPPTETKWERPSPISEPLLFFFFRPRCEFLFPPFSPFRRSNPFVDNRPGYPQPTLFLFPPPP